MREETSFNLKNQASNIDYANSSGFTKGQLFPSTYGFTEIQRRSTFTLIMLFHKMLHSTGGPGREWRTALNVL